MSTNSQEIKVEELREWMNDYIQRPWNYGPTVDDLLTDLQSRFLTPSLPTLADMTPEERGACRWMQCDVETDHGDTIGVIRVVWASRVDVLFQSGAGLDVEHRRVTPRPDLPRLEWPVQEAPNKETPPAETTNNPSSDTPRNSEEIVKVIRYEKELCLSNQDSSRAMLWRNMERAAGQGEWKDLLNSIRELKLPKDSDTPRNPRPEDVPAGEAWLILHNGHEWVGARDDSGTTNYPWALAKIDGTDYALSQDVEVTIVSRLVPESHTLPEGMRLADHEEYGRVVTSPWGDGVDDYKIFFLNEDVRAGADYEYANESTLTFLDGEA